MNAATDNYLAALPIEQRMALQALREQIMAVVPGIVEHFAYGVPAFRYNGHPLVYMGASKHHCGLYGSIPPGLQEALKDFKMGKGSIQFTPDKPIPTHMIKALVKAKCAEIDVRWPVKAHKVKSTKATKQQRTNATPGRARSDKP